MLRMSYEATRLCLIILCAFYKIMVKCGIVEKEKQSVCGGLGGGGKLCDCGGQREFG